MTQLTRGGVAYDLTKSPFNYIIQYPDESIIYWFSSDMYRRKFENAINSNRITINNSLSKRFGYDIEHNKLCDLKLYATIEKRGFLIESENHKFLCQNNIKLDGLKLIPKN